MNDMYAAWKDFFALLFNNCWMLKWNQKIGYSKNKRTDNNNYRNGYYPERTVATEMGWIIDGNYTKTLQARLNKIRFNNLA